MVISPQGSRSTYTLCSEKNTHSHFLSYRHEWCVDLNKNCSEYTQGKVDSDNVEIRYSLRPLASLWCHICLAKVGASLQPAISREPRISFFASTEYLLVHRRGCIVYYVVKFKRQLNIKHLFIHKPDYVRSPLTQDHVTATECRRWLMQIHTCVKEKGGYFEHKFWHFNS